MKDKIKEEEVLEGAEKIVEEELKKLLDKSDLLPYVKDIRIKFLLEPILSIVIIRVVLLIRVRGDLEELLSILHRFRSLSFYLNRSFETINNTIRRRSKIEWLKHLSLYVLPLPEWGEREINFIDDYLFNGASMVSRGVVSWLEKGELLKNLEGVVSKEVIRKNIENYLSKEQFRA